MKVYTEFKQARYDLVKLQNATGFSFNISSFAKDMYLKKGPDCDSSKEKNYTDYIIRALYDKDIQTMIINKAYELNKIDLDKSIKSIIKEYEA